MRWNSALALAFILASGSPAAAQQGPAEPGIEAQSPTPRQTLGDSIRSRFASRLRGAAQARLSQGFRSQQSACMSGTLSSLLRRITSRTTGLGGVAFGARSKATAAFASSLRERLRSGGASAWVLNRSRLTSGQPEQQATGQPGDKDWTVFVYLNGDNNIHSAMLDELADLAQVGSSERVNVVALWDGSKLYGEGDGKDKSQLLLVEKGGTKVLKDFGELDMGNPETLEQSLSLVMKQFPAQKTALIVGNHGFGWQGVSGDEDSGNSIEVDSMGAVLDRVAKNAGKKLDLLGYDACLMNAAEANYPVRNGAKYLVASQEMEWSPAWDFGGILGALTQKPTMNGKELAETIVDSYGKAYREGGCAYETNQKGMHAVTMSAIDLEKFCGAKEHIDRFAEALKGACRSNEKKVIGEVLRQTQRFHDEGQGSVDLVDFACKMAAKTENPEIKACATRLSDYLTKDVIIANTTVCPDPEDPGVANAHGMSINFPGRDAYMDGYATYKRYQREAYSGLSLSKDGKWKEMLDTYYDKIDWGEPQNTAR